MLNRRLMNSSLGRSANKEDRLVLQLADHTALA